jgi:hypothetical protein
LKLFSLSPVRLFLANRTEADDAKKLTLSGKIVTWLAGTITAAYIGPLIIEAATLPAKATAGVIFFAGLGALSFAEALLKQMPEIIKALRIKFLGG